MHREETPTRKLMYKNNFLDKISHNSGKQDMYKIMDNSQKTLNYSKIIMCIQKFQMISVTFLRRDKATENSKEIRMNKKSLEFFSKNSERTICGTKQLLLQL